MSSQSSAGLSPAEERRYLIKLYGLRPPEGEGAELREDREGISVRGPLPPSMKLAGVVLADQMKSLDGRARKAQLVLQLPDHLTEQVLQKLHTVLA